MLTDVEIRAKLSADAIALGSRARAADTYGISPTHFANLLIGQKPFTPAILMRLGLPEEAEAKAVDIGDMREKNEKSKHVYYKVSYVRGNNSYNHHIGRDPVGLPVPKPLLARNGDTNSNDDNPEKCDDINKIRYSYNKPPLTPDELERKKRRFFRRMKQDVLCIERFNSEYGKLMYSILIKEGKAGIIDV